MTPRLHVRLGGLGAALECRLVATEGRGAAMRHGPPDNDATTLKLPRDNDTRRLMTQSRCNDTHSPPPMAAISPGDPLRTHDTPRAAPPWVWAPLMGPAKQCIALLQGRTHAACYVVATLICVPAPCPAAVPGRRHEEGNGAFPSASGRCVAGHSGGCSCFPSSVYYRVVNNAQPQIFWCVHGSDSQR